MKSNIDGVKLTLVNPITGRKHEKFFAVGEKFTIEPNQVPEDSTGGFANDTTFPTAIVDGQETALGDVVEPEKVYEVVEDGGVVGLEEVGQEDDE